MLLLTLGHHVGMLLLDHGLDHEVDLEVGIARLKDPSLAQGALSAHLQRTLEALLAESVATRRRHWLVHQLPADGTLELL